jgi:hypothetical protein
VITCSSYANRHAVYSAATFCPVCGLRPTTDIVLELIQPHGTCWQRKTGSKRTSARALRAGGMFERRLAVDVLKSVVSVFESFARQQFFERVSNAEELTFPTAATSSSASTTPLRCPQSTWAST